MAQTQRLGSVHTTVSVDDEGWTNVQYHDTVVVRFNDTVIHLNTGGYKTNTTKTRMNQASNQFDLGYHIFQKRKRWFVALNTGVIEPFTHDGMTIIRL